MVPFCHPPELYAELQERFGGLNFADFQETSIDDAWLHQARRLLLKEVERKESIGKMAFGTGRLGLLHAILEV